MADLFVLGYTSEQIGQLTLFDAINLIDAHTFKTQQTQNLLAEFVTLPIWNSAGKTTKKTLKLEDFFVDGRFGKSKQMSKAEQAHWRKVLGERR